MKPVVKNNEEQKEVIYKAFMQSPVAIILLKRDTYVIEFANQFYLQLLGKDKSILGQSLFTIFPELIGQGALSFMDNIVESKVAQHIREHEFVVTKNKIPTQCFFNCEYQPIMESNNAASGLIILFTDVTEQVLLKRESLSNQSKLMKALKIANEALVLQAKDKRVKEKELLIANIELDYQSKEKINRANELLIANEELLIQIVEKEKRVAELIIANYSRSLIEATLDPLITINTNGQITDMNEAMVQIVDVSRADLIGTSFINYFTNTEKAKKAQVDVFAKGFIVEYPLTLKDGKLIDVLFNGSVYKDGDGYVQGAVLVGRDITEQKRIEKELIEAKEIAEKSMLVAEDEKTKAVIAAIAAENATKSKQQFLSNMSHEIRTPMNAIIGFTKVVLKTDLNDKQKEYVNAIKTSGDALIVLINDILDLAKVDAGKMIFENVPFKLDLSVKAMLHLFETKMKEKNLDLVVCFDENIPKVLLGDPVRLHQIILNLVSNALKFTQKGTISIFIKMLNEDDEKVAIEFSIKDTGIGIASEKIGKIFESFHQATSGTSRLYGGTGLGLAIVKELVELQGGNIAVESVVDQGSTFSFILNFTKSNITEILETEIIDLDTELKDIEILVVEDMELNQLLIKTLLDDFGFRSDLCSNGKFALEKLALKNYDIILMDLQMPEMNGFETTEYIRNILKSNIPIIALTADVTTVDVSKCKSVGMNDYISKPVDERLLYSKIVNLIKKPEVLVTTVQLIEAIEEHKIIKCIDLQYLHSRTKSNPKLMMEMMSIYLDQTPPLILLMKRSFKERDWKSLDAVVHKLIPSFAIMGIKKDYETMAKKIQHYAMANEDEKEIQKLVMQLEKILSQSCKELVIEFNKIKNKVI